MFIGAPQFRPMKTDEQDKNKWKFMRPHAYIMGKVREGILKEEVSFEQVSFEF